MKKSIITFLRSLGRKKFIFALIGILVYGSTCMVVSAYDYMGLGQWASGKVNYAIETDDSSYVTPIMEAAAMWTNNSNYKLTRNNSSRINVYVQDFGNISWDGLTYVNGQTNRPISADYSYVHIKINRHHADSYNSLRKKLVACHEFGHSASLWHVTNYVMMYHNDVWTAYQNNSSLANSPAQDDINGINNRY